MAKLNASLGQKQPVDGWGDAGVQPVPVPYPTMGTSVSFAESNSQDAAVATPFGIYMKVEEIEGESTAPRDESGPLGRGDIAMGDLVITPGGKEPLAAEQVESILDLMPDMLDFGEQAYGPNTPFPEPAEGPIEPTTGTGPFASDLTISTQPDLNELDGSTFQVATDFDFIF